ncbi:hypothetical protein [Litorimonas sp. WD9-15]|uniref:hypothetical protein n=1 Tax=Litorimonas sp. WD9-15 TaxID=3418716 RepID=UPI003D00F5CE
MAEPINQGFKPTLFPMMSSGEDQATSIFFGMMCLVLPLRDTLLRTISRSAYKSGNDFSAFLHPSFGGKYSKKDVPDGVIHLEQKENWSALVEVKIKKQDLSNIQLDNYLQRVKESNMDALITISNELCAKPDRPPLRLKSSNKNFRKIPHYHWSWQFIRFQVKKLLNSDDGLTEIERELLSQFLNFLEHPKSGVAGFTSMPKDWKKLVDKLREGGKPDQDMLEDSVSGWFQETAELALILSGELGVEVEEMAILDSVERRREDAVNRLAETGDLVADFRIESCKSPLNVKLDVDRRCVQFSVTHDVPTSAKTPFVQVQHFLRRFHQEDERDQWGAHEDVRVFCRWPRAKDKTDMTLFDAIQHSIDDEMKNSPLIRQDKDKIMDIDLCYTPSKVSSKISSRNQVITLLEEEAVFFARNYLPT